MSCLQAAALKPLIYAKKDSFSCNIRPNAFFRVNCWNRSLRLSSMECKWQKFAPVIKHQSTSNYRKLVPVGLFGGKGKSEGENEGSAWKSLEKAMGSFRKEASIEDVLRQQMEKQEFFDDGNTGGKPPGQGGGGGGGGRGDLGGAEDEGFAGILDETVQVVLATLGFIFLYVYIITGEELVRLLKDFIKYLFSGSKSVRLRRAMYKWGRVYKKMTEKKEVDPFWLEREIINTATRYDSPEKYRRLFRSSETSRRKLEPEPELEPELENEQQYVEEF